MRLMARRSQVLLAVLILGGCSTAPLAPTAQFPGRGDPRIPAAYQPDGLLYHYRHGYHPFRHKRWHYRHGRRIMRVHPY